MRQLNLSEMAAIYKHYKPQTEKEAQERMKNPMEIFHRVGTTRDIIGGIAGVSGELATPSNNSVTRLEDIGLSRIESSRFQRVKARPGPEPEIGNNVLPNYPTLSDLGVFLQDQPKVIGRPEKGNNVLPLLSDLGVFLQEQPKATNQYAGNKLLPALSDLGVFLQEQPLSKGGRPTENLSQDASGFPTLSDSKVHPDPDLYYCPKCQTVLPKQVEYCWRCGYPGEVSR